MPFIAGCSGGKKEGVVTIWWPGGSDAEKAALYDAREKYLALPENDGLQIKIIEKASSQFYTDYMIATQGNDYPDAAYVDHVYVQQLAHEGTIANLSKEDTEIDTVIKDKMIDSLWNVNAYEGDTYGLPVSANTMSLVYNKVVLRAAYAHKGLNWTEDDVPTTWAELMTACGIVKEYSDTLGDDAKIVPFTVPSGNGANNNSMASLSFLSFVAREGGSIISDDLKTMLLNSNPVKAAAEKIYSLRVNGGLGYSTATFEEGKFEAGKAAFIEMGPWKLQTYKLLSSQSESCDFGWAPLVKFSESGDNTSSLGLFSVVVTDKSINKAAAIEFMKFFVTDDELMLKQNTSQNLISPLKSTRENEFYKTPEWQVYMSQIDNVAARPGSPEWGTMETKIGEFVTQLLLDSREPSYLTSLNAVLQQGLDDLYSGGF